MLGCSRRSRLSVLFPALTLVLMLASSARAADPLTWTFTPGAKHRYRLTQDMTTSIDLGPGGEVDAKTSQVLDLTWTVAEVNDDGNAVLKQKIDRIQLTMDAPGAGGEVTFDSQSPDEPQGFAAMIAPLLKETVRSECTLTMTPRGKVVGVDIPESLVRTLAAAPGAKALGELATAEGFKNVLSGVSFELPETLEPGAEQSNTVMVTNAELGTEAIKSTLRYLGPKEIDGAALEAFAPSREITFEGVEGAQAAILDQKSQGELLFNRAAGRLESSQLDHTLKLAIDVDGQEVQQTVQVHAEVRLLPEGEE
jgi:hypothetical protein